MYIPKNANELRPIGIPTLEDTVLQKAVVMVLGPIYEEEFYPISFGFRPGKSQHQAIQEVFQRAGGMRGGWILDVDVSKFFDTIEHAKIRELIRLRVNDGVITRIIDKWLKAGVWEAGELSRSELGTPQGGVISPLLSNIYLHHVLDKWFYEVVKPRMKGEVFLVRYADDFIMGFKEKSDLERVMNVIPKRFEKFGLTVHPEKTRCIPFQRPKWKADADKEETRSFDFLGFTHYWGKSQNRFWVVKRKTSKKRLRTKLESIGEWMKENMHKPVSEQQEMLSADSTAESHASPLSIYILCSHQVRQSTCSVDSW